MNQPSQNSNFDISPDTLLRAAQERYGADAEVSAPYWVDAQVIRVGVALHDSDVSFGANYDYRAGVFQ